MKKSGMYLIHIPRQNKYVPNLISVYFSLVKSTLVVWLPAD